MNSPMVLFRPMRRPFLLFAVVMWVSVCVMWPLSELSDAGLPAHALWDGETSPEARKSITATLGLATQLVHWLALHRHFATADLAGSR